MNISRRCCSPVGCVLYKPFALYLECPTHLLAPFLWLIIAFATSHAITHCSIVLVSASLAIVLDLAVCLWHKTLWLYSCYAVAFFLSRTHFTPILSVCSKLAHHSTSLSVYHPSAHICLLIVCSFHIPWYLSIYSLPSILLVS